MTTPRRLRRDQRERTPKMVLRYKGQTLTREQAVAAKAQFKRAGSVAVVGSDWEVIYPAIDVLPVAYDDGPCNSWPWATLRIVSFVLAVVALILGLIGVIA